MALRRVRRGAPATKLITPIANPVSRGLVEEGDRALFLQREQAISASPAVVGATSSSGRASGSRVGAATSIHGGVGNAPRLPR